MNALEGIDASLHSERVEAAHIMKILYADADGREPDMWTLRLRHESNVRHLLVGGFKVYRFRTSDCFKVTGPEFDVAAQATIHPRILDGFHPLVLEGGRVIGMS